MTQTANDIQTKHVYDAVLYIEKNKINLIRFTRLDVIINGISYPAKEIMKHAFGQLTGENKWSIAGGEPTNKYLKNMGFNVVEKKSDAIIQLIAKYKARLEKTGLGDEIYKWKNLFQYAGRPDLSKENLSEEFRVN
jgi:hypothetical protein